MQCSAVSSRGPFCNEQSDEWREGVKEQKNKGGKQENRKASQQQVTLVKCMVTQEGGPRTRARSSPWCTVLVRIAFSLLFLAPLPHCLRHALHGCTRRLVASRLSQAVPLSLVPLPCSLGLFVLVDIRITSRTRSQGLDLLGRERDTRNEEGFRNHDLPSPFFSKREGDTQTRVCHKQ